MHKFEAGKGKAFSYFSIVAKNYLIFHNNNNYKRFNQHVDISETPGEDSVCLQTEDAHHKTIQTQEFMKLLINYWEKNITKIFTKQKDLNIAYAVIELFRSSDRIENFNKKTLYLYIRELSNCKTQQITKIINKMKSYQNVVMKNYIDSGKVSHKTKQINHSKRSGFSIYRYMDLNFEIYKGKNFSGLCKDIVKNSESKKDQIDILISELRSLIKTINDATIIVPMIKDYYDVGIKNDEQLVKLAAVVQRLVAKGEASGEGTSMVLSEDERKQLMDEVITISKGE